MRNSYRISEDRRAQFSELREQSANLRRASQEIIDQTKRLLEELKADRKNRFAQVPAGKWLAEATFAWLSVEAFNRLTRVEKEVYLRRLAEHLKEELGLQNSTARAPAIAPPEEGGREKT